MMWFLLGIGCSWYSSEANAKLSSNQQELVWFDDNGACQYKGTAGYLSDITEVSIGKLEKTSTAIEKAKKSATEKLLAQRCSGHTEEACNQLRQRTQTISYSISDKKDRVCALAQIKAEVAKDPLGQIGKEKKIDQDMLKILSQYQKTFSNKSILFTSPTKKGSSCSAGLTGAEITMRFSNFAIQKGIPVLKQKQSDTVILQTELIPRDDHWIVELTAKQPKKTIVLGSFKYPTSFVDKTTSNDTCLSSSDARLQQGRSNHSSGLSVEIQLGEDKNEWCEMDATTFQINASAEADIRVFSIIDDKTQIMVYPNRGVPDYQPATHFDLGTLNMVPLSSTPKEEALLVVAVPKGTDFGWLEDSGNLCYLKEDVADWLPKDVAFDSFNFTIYPAGSEYGRFNCDVEKLSLDERRENAEIFKALLKQMPSCR